MGPAAGRLIVLEGIDGSGISTQCRLLCEWLNEKGQRCHLTKEPSAGPAGALVRLVLGRRLGWDDGGEFREMDERTLALLFAADRADHLVSEIEPRLAEGIHVVSDRYVLSTCAYHSLELDLEWIEAVNSAFRVPDLTVFLDVPVEVCLARLERSRVNFERRESPEELARVRQNFLSIMERRKARNEPIGIVPAGDKGIEQVAQLVREAVGAVRESPLQGGG